MVAVDPVCDPLPIAAAALTTHAWRREVLRCLRRFLTAPASRPAEAAGKCCCGEGDYCGCGVGEACGGAGDGAGGVDDDSFGGGGGRIGAMLLIAGRVEKELCADHVGNDMDMECNVGILVVPALLEFPFTFPLPLLFPFPLLKLPTLPPLPTLATLAVPPLTVPLAGGEGPGALLAAGAGAVGVGGPPLR